MKVMYNFQYLMDKQINDMSFFNDYLEYFLIFSETMTTNLVQGRFFLKIIE